MAITFDTLKFVDTLEQAQVPREQARAIAAAVCEAHDSADVATKGDIALVRKDMDLLRWMLGIVMGGIVALILKAFF